MRNQLLGGRYRILERIGEGGMAYVYLALDEKLGRRVAIKVLHEHMERNEDIRKRFQLEAQAVSGLDHPNIVKIYDFSGSGSERLWIVTEVIDGKNLAQYVEKQPGHELHPVIATFIVREIAKALERAHSQGIVHRDIKPENIMITKQGRVKLMDFGIAKDLGKSSMTMTGTFMGSPSYMSPEQVRGKDVDYRSDLYSLSVLFYEIVTGRLPFTGQTTHDVVLKIMDGKFTYPRFIVPAIPEEIDRLIVKCMSMNPEARLRSASDYGQYLDTFLERNSFLDSHIELERYFKNRKAFEKRLGKQRNQFAGNNPALKTNRPTRVDATNSRTRNRTNVKGTAVAPPFQQDNTWQKHIPDRARTTADSSNKKSAARSRTVALRPGQGSRLQPVQDPRQTALIQEQSALHQPVRAQQVKRRPPQRRPRIQKVSSGRRHRPETIAPIQSNWITGVFGLMLVGVVAAVAIWGFWELAERIDVKKSSETSTAEQPKEIRTPRLPSPPKVTTTTPRDSDRINVRPASQTTNPKERIKRKPKKTRKTRIAKNRKPLKTKSKVLQRSEDTKNLIMETTQITAIKPVVDKPVEKPQVEDPPPQPKDIEVEKPVEPESGPAQASFKSNPAAEVYVNGKRMGTTVDATVTSGWLELGSGTHRVELRRQGYETWKRTFKLNANDRRQFPMVSLNQQSLDAAKFKLTLKVSPVPATVTIRNLDANQTTAFALKTKFKSVDLGAGRYQVKVKYGNQTRERHIILSGKGRNFTFNAEFKEEEQ